MLIYQRVFRFSKLGFSKLVRQILEVSGLNLMGCDGIISRLYIILKHIVQWS